MLVKPFHMNEPFPIDATLGLDANFYERKVYLGVGWGGGGRQISKKLKKSKI